MHKAIELLAGVCRTYPHNLHLNSLYLEELLKQDPGKAEERCHQLKKRFRHNSQFLFDFARVLLSLEKNIEGMEVLNEALGLDPGNSFYHSLAGYTYLKNGQRAQAIEAYREAIRLSADNRKAIEGLVQAGADRSEKINFLQYIQSEQERQPLLGEGILAFYAVACFLLPPDELLKILNEALRQRPDLWACWATLLQHFLDTGHLEEAEQTVSKARNEFPLMPLFCLQAAKIALQKGQMGEALDAAEQARQLNPAWPDAVGFLVNLYQARGKNRMVIKILRQGYNANPGDPYFLIMLASLYFKAMDADEGTNYLGRAFRLVPGEKNFGEMLWHWAETSQKYKVAISLAEAISEDCPGDPGAQVFLAETAYRFGNPEKGNIALETALRLNPRFIPAYDLKALKNHYAGNYNDALEACEPEILTPVPGLLQIRKAWIHMQWGKLEKAREELEKIIVEFPEILWGWNTYLESLYFLEEYDTILELKENLELRFPENGYLPGLCGEILLKREQWEAARCELEKAFTMEPAYIFVGNNLFDLYIQEKNLAGAAEILRQMQTHRNPQEPEFLCRKGQLLTLQNQPEQAIGILKKMLRIKEAPEKPLTDLTCMMVEQTLEATVKSILNNCAAGEVINKTGALLWIHYYACKHPGRSLSTMHNLYSRHGFEIVVKFVIGFQDMLAAALAQGNKLKLPSLLVILNILCRRYGRVLKESPLLHTSLGEMLLMTGKIKACRELTGTMSYAKIASPHLVSLQVTALLLEGKSSQAAEILHTIDRKEWDSLKEKEKMGQLRLLLKTLS